MGNMRILDLVGNCRTIGISGHENPDGDCVGSCVGMALFLRKKLPGARVDIFLEKIPPELESNIPGTDTVIHDYRTEVSRYDAFILLDTGTQRCGGAGPLFDKALCRINIDHHISNPGCGDFNYIDGKAGSACELVYDCIDKEDLDAQIAQALYVGIVTDTGCFRFDSTRESTMQTAGKLMTYGFDFSSIVREVYYERSYIQMKVLGEAFRNAHLRADGLMILSVMDRNMQQKLNAGRMDMEGVSEQLVQTRGVDLSVFIYEVEEGLWRCSLRSNRIVNVSAIAQHIGGGGHIRASGCSVRPNDAAALADLIEEMALAQAGR